MSFSEVSSQTTLLSLSLLGTESSISFSERYREKYKDQKYIYEDWLKQAKPVVINMVKEIDSKMIELKIQQKTSAELYESIKESHRDFQESMSCLRQPKKRKISDIEK